MVRERISEYVSPGKPGDLDPLKAAVAASHEMLVGLLHRKVHTIETGRFLLHCDRETRLDRPSFV
jgi:hypothetical protein